jgi:hypothetical protein
MNKRNGHDFGDAYDLRSWHSREGIADVAFYACCPSPQDQHIRTAFPLNHPPLFMLPPGAIHRSMIPWVLPAHQSRAVLLRAVHQLSLLASSVTDAGAATYEEPHGCAETGCHESIERSDRVDVNGVVWVRRIFGRTHAGSCGLHGVCRACVIVSLGDSFS